MTELKMTDLQAYLVDHYKGWANEQDLFMKLVEEMGEIAELLNKRSGRKSSSGEALQTELGLEIVDLIHYAVAIAAINDLNLNDLILAKDKEAAVKYQHTSNLETFIQERQV